MVNGAVGQLPVVAVHPAVAIKAGIEADHLDATFRQIRSQDGADIAVDPGNQDTHGACFLLQNLLPAAFLFCRP